MKMTRDEISNTLILAAIFALRMLGLFMLLPVLALYLNKIPGASAQLVGVAVGIYGLTQALFQLPYGMLSDYINRKWVITLGLLVFAIGSVVAALATDMGGLIVGRALQGAGAIGSPVLALLSDVTRESVRTRAMALLGMSIGATFLLALLLGPLLEAQLGLQGIFILTAGLAIGGIGLLKVLVLPPNVRKAERFSFYSLQQAYSQSDVWLLSAIVFILHAMFTASFLFLPIKIQAVTALSLAQVWKFYLPVLFFSLLFVAPFLRRVDTDKEVQKKWFGIAMCLCGVSILLFNWSEDRITFSLIVTLFFVAFNFLEASLPALMSRIVASSNKGMAMGFYSCFQFFGIFCGGVIGGVLQESLGSAAIAGSCLFISMLGWLTIKKLNYFSIERIAIV